MFSRITILSLLVLLAGCAHFTWVLPTRDGECPESHPIKGNADSGYYHLPRGLYYTKVRAEKCFRHHRDAERARFKRAGR